MEAGPCVDQEKAAGKCLAWFPQSILGGNQVLMVQAQREAEEKGALQRGNGEKEEKRQEMLGKEKIYPNYYIVSQQGSVGHSMSGAGGQERQVTDLDILVIATRSEMVSGRPSQGVGVNVANAASLIGPAGEPLEMSPGERSIELQRVGISSVVRL